MTYNNYRLVEQEKIVSANGQGILLEHVKTGAKVFVLSNDDENKVFNIIFRTPPADDTGLPHVLEHSVLCGSRKYPVKDPFVELAKGSLNTFLNAMTYPDKTMYPVASCNAKDFRNLSDVYLDAVFYPNIYSDGRILQQEGWHYELDDINKDVTLNGVVYNEMKGASSSAEQVLFRQIQAALFPDHPYGKDSGGDPEAIPNLTQEQFETFHSTFYHPSNSYIFLYGDFDVEEQLDWLDTAYLSAFDQIEVASELEIVPAFEAPMTVEASYAIGSEESEEKRTYLSYNVAMSKPQKQYECVGLEILEYLLMDAPGAIMKDALLELGIAEDVFGSFDGGLRQPMFSIVAKNANVEDEAVFIEKIEEVLRKLVEEGIEERKLQAAINNFEFKFRESDFGQYPKGVIYSIKAMETWLYDGNPFDTFDYGEAFTVLRKGIDEGLFSHLISQYLLNNTHKAYLRLVPDKTLMQKRTDSLNQKMAAYTASLSLKDKEALIEETAALKVYQAEPNSKEALETIPLLSLDDIDPKIQPIEYEVVKDQGMSYVIHKTFTNNIAYMKMVFDFSMLSFEEVPYIGLMTKLLTRLGTQNYSLSELTDEINITTGGIRTGLNIYGIQDNPVECMPRFEVKFKCFGEKIDSTLALVEEVVCRTVLEDSKKIMDLILESKSRLTMGLMNSGHTASMTRSLSYHTLSGKYKDLLEGIGYYQFLETVTPETLDEVIAKLSEVYAKVVTTSNAAVMINTEEGLVEQSKLAIEGMLSGIPEGIAYEEELALDFKALNEGFKTSSKVQYCALTGNYAEEGYAYSGDMKVLQTLMSLDYMWKEVRIKGGAYGGFAGFRKSGVFYMGSYRDPNLRMTYKIYEGLTDYVRNLDFDERELTKYIIGTISGMDTPLTPQMKGEKAMASFMSGMTNEMAQDERDEVLGTTIESLRSLGEIIEKLLAQNYRCVIGNEQKLEEEKESLNQVVALFK